MAYRVEVTPRAARDLRVIYQRIHAVHAAQAQAWFNGLTERILSLDQHPRRGACIDEGHGLRQVLYGSNRNVYRVIYRVDDARSVVSVLHIRHGAQDAFRSEGGA